MVGGAAGAVKARCVCGCGGTRRLQLHHAVYQQEIRKRLLELHRAKGVAGPPDLVVETAWLRDPRNLVPVNVTCHAGHHSRRRPLPLHVLPSSVFEFAVELLGEGAAFEYLRRRYDGGDPRLDALLSA